MPTYQGGCFCKASQFVVEATPINQRICHCRICQKTIGAAFNARVLFHMADVEITGPARFVHSSPDLERGFCPECGTTMFSRRTSASVIGVTTSSLEDPSLFRPEMHIWVASKQPWVMIEDGLPQHEGAPSA